MVGLLVGQRPVLGPLGERGPAGGVVAGDRVAAGQERFEDVGAAPGVGVLRAADERDGDAVGVPRPAAPGAATEELEGLPVEVGVEVTRHLAEGGVTRRDRSVDADLDVGEGRAPGGPLEGDGDRLVVRGEDPPVVTADPVRRVGRVEMEGEAFGARLLDAPIRKVARARHDADPAPASGGLTERARGELGGQVGRRPVGETVEDPTDGALVEVALGVVERAGCGTEQVSLAGPQQVAAERRRFEVERLGSGAGATGGQEAALAPFEVTVPVDADGVTPLGQLVAVVRDLGAGGAGPDRRPPRRGVGRLAGSRDELGLRGVRTGGEPVRSVALGPGGGRGRQQCGDRRHEDERGDGAATSGHGLLPVRCVPRDASDGRPVTYLPVRENDRRPVG